ncbi:MAG: hypothetical protein DCC64_15485 [Planctomycetota bacterium]|nr:MAG: hypothetical protein DCC64_15485 [Planctomycetota bacterium]
MSMAAPDDRGGFTGSLYLAVAELEAAVLDIEELERRARWVESRKRRLASLADKLRGEVSGGLARRLANVASGLSQGMLHSRCPRERVRSRRGQTPKRQ